MSKHFFGFETKTRAEKAITESGRDIKDAVITEKVINVIDDPCRWPQTSSIKKTVTTLEFEDIIVSYASSNASEINRDKDGRLVSYKDIDGNLITLR